MLAGKLRRPALIFWRKCDWSWVSTFVLDWRQTQQHPIPNSSHSTQVLATCKWLGAVPVSVQLGALLVWSLPEGPPGWISVRVQSASDSGTAVAAQDLMIYIDPIWFNTGWFNNDLYIYIIYIYISHNMNATSSAVALQSVQIGGTGFQDPSQSLSSPFQASAAPSSSSGMPSAVPAFSCSDSNRKKMYQASPSLSKPIKFITRFA